VSARPSPPGDYGVVVVGSGPGGLQSAYELRRLGVQTAVVSADDGAGGMFRRWPLFQRLISWSKPDAPFPRDTREYEWYDHNSLIAEEPDLRALVPAQMARTVAFPSRAEAEAAFAQFAARAAIPVRYRCGWEATRREFDGRLVLETSDGAYRCRAAVFALGVTEPWKPDVAGIEAVPHYADVGRPEDLAGTSVVIVGKRNSAFELADALLPWARRITLVSPRAVERAVLSHSTVSVRYHAPLEDEAHGGGTIVLDGAVDRVVRSEAGYAVHVVARRPAGTHVLEADAVIAATGFRTPLHDLPELGVSVVARGRLPALTPFFESTSAPGIFFAGNTSQGAPGLRKHGFGAPSTAVRGFRYNARVLAEHLAERLGAWQRQRPIVGDVAAYLARELAHAPELWVQKAYLARVVSLGRPARDEGIAPLEHFLDAGGDDAVAATVEIDSAGRIYPMLYLRRDRRIREVALDPHPLHAFDGPEYVRQLALLV
jgi:thioredoxin reductase